MANGLFTSIDEARRAAQDERAARIQQIGQGSPWAMAGAALGGMFGGGVDQDPRVQKARTLQEARQAVEAKGLDLVNKPGEFLGSLAQELNQRGLTAEAMQVMEQYQQVATRQAQTESAQARQKLTETRGRIEESKEDRAAQLFGGQLAKSQADAQASQTKAHYAGATAEANLQSKLASIETSRMNANTALLNAQNAKDRNALDRELKGLSIEKRKLEIETMRTDMQAQGMTPKEIRSGVTDLSKQADKAGIPALQKKLEQLRSIGAGGKGYAYNIKNFPEFMKSQRGQTFSQLYQSAVNAKIKAESGAAVSAHEMERQQIALGVHVTQGPEAVLRGMKMMQDEADARWQNMLRGYSQPVKEQFESNFPAPQPAQAPGGPSDAELDAYLD